MDHTSYRVNIDAEHERRIAAALARYYEACSRDAESMTATWAEFTRLHAQRTPEQVARMEKSMGLR